MARPSAEGVVFSNKRPQNKTAHIEDPAVPRDMETILEEKIFIGNSHLSDFILTMMARASRREPLLVPRRSHKSVISPR
jgi:hypothetical protein